MDAEGEGRWQAKPHGCRENVEVAVQDVAEVVGKVSYDMSP